MCRGTTLIPPLHSAVLLPKVTVGEPVRVEFLQETSPYSSQGGKTSRATETFQLTGLLSGDADVKFDP